MNLQRLLFIPLAIFCIAAVSYSAFVFADYEMESMEIIRNGNFDGGNAAWGFSNTFNNGLGKVEDGISVFDILAVSSEEAFGLMFQPLSLPDEWSSGTVRFRHRYELEATTEFSTSGELQVTIVDGESNPLIAVALISSATSTDWTEIEYTFTEDEIALIQQQQANGVQPFLLFYFQIADTFGMDLWLDDVSFVVEGTPDVRPELDGAIAYLGHNADNRSTMLKMIQPDGGGEQTIRTINDLFRLRDVAWRPDGTELAYISSESISRSYFLADLFAIQIDGNGLRRLTNYPDSSNVANYPTGRVTGSISTVVSNLGSVAVHAQGAQNIVSGRLDVDSSASFDLTVADLGEGVSQPIYITYDGANGIETQLLLTTLDVEAGEAVDVGTLSVEGDNGVSLTALDLSWQRDGDFVAFTLRELNGADTLQQVEATGGLFGTDLIDATFVSAPALSPIDDQVLYYRTTGKGQGICLNNVGGTLDDENCLVPLSEFLADPRPVWLNDGRGFIFSSGNNLFSYNFASQEAVQLTNVLNETARNASVSPDGNYLVYERASTQGSDLWILELADSTNTWPITNDGRSSNPDWSKVAPTVPTPTPTPTPTVEPTSTPTPTPLSTLDPNETLEDKATVVPTSTHISTPTTTPVPTSTPSTSHPIYLPIVLK